MMKAYRIYVGILMVLIAGKPALTQDIHFSQYYASPFLINPGSIGVFDGTSRLALNYRNQWTTLNSNYQTTAVAFEKSFKKTRGKKNFLGVGVNVISDKAGIGALKRLGLNLGAAYHIQVTEDHLIGIGLQGGFAQRSIDMGALTWDTQYDGTQFNAGADSQEKFQGSTGYGDFGAGLHWVYALSKSADMNAGGGIFHVNQPLENLDLNNRTGALPMKIVGHGSGRFTSQGSDLGYYPHFMVAFQGPSREITAGMNVRYMLRESSKYTGIVKGNAVYFGADYRLGDAVIILLGLELSDWELGISYDVNTSGFKKATGSVGGIEFSLVWVKSD